MDLNTQKWQTRRKKELGRLESVRYGEGTIKIQEIVAILKIPQIGEYVPLVIEGAGERETSPISLAYFPIKTHPHFAY